jgi:hypothetical protein
MNISYIYIAAVVGALLILAMLAYATVKAARPGGVTLLAGLAFVSVLAGILLGEQQLAGYALMALGVILALVDILKKSRGPVG